MRLAKPKPSRWRRPAAACLVVMLPAVRSSAGVVAVQLKRAGNGSPGRTAGGLRIVDGSTTEVLAATSVGARSRAKLGAPPGVEFAVATVARPKGLREAVSDVFRFDGGGVLCETYGEGQCVDRVGHTVVTFRLAGSGARLGALHIDGGDDGLVDVAGVVAVRVGCGSAGFAPGDPVPVPAAATACPTFYHPGATVTITARRKLPPSPYLGNLFCASTFTGFSGAVDCAGMGVCNKNTCSCTIVTGTEKTEIVATYDAEGTGCIPAAAP